MSTRGTETFVKQTPDPFFDRSKYPLGQDISRISGVLVRDSGHARIKDQYPEAHTVSESISARAIIKGPSTRRGSTHRMRARKAEGLVRSLLIEAS